MHRVVPFVVAALAGLAAIATAAPVVGQDPTATNIAPTPTSTETVEVQTNVPYYEGGPTLDAYLPKNGQTNRPALVLVHGRGWNSGDKAEFAPFALQAANEQQWAVFDVDYGLSATDPAAWPDELHDVQAAIRFIATNAPGFGIDPRKVVALGESAGANLLALISSEGTANPISGEPVGNDPTLAVHVRAVGLWSPPVDLAALHAGPGPPPAGCGPDQACDFTWSQSTIGAYFRCDPTGCPQAYAEASPITWVSANTAPSFVAHSTDELVPMAQVQRYANALQSAGVTNQFVPLPGNLHGIQYGAQVWAQTVAFLNQGLIDPPPTTTTTTTTTPTALVDTSVAVAGPSDRNDDEGTILPTIVGIVAAAGVLVLVSTTLLRLRARR
jgi:acetyl esterase/lipase